MDNRIRRARVADADTIAGVHIAAWRESYAGRMPEAVLDGFSRDEWRGRWEKRFAELADDPAGAIFLALDSAGLPAGFGCCSRQTSAKLRPLGYDGEISSLYLLRRIQGEGMGRRLVGTMTAHLRAQGCTACGFWVFIDSREARAFYETLGAAPVGIEGVWETFGMTLPDMAYGWRDLQDVAAVAG
jgi:GNAT superfamily N-acetyltransferase